MKSYFLFAFKSLMHRRLRSWLTILGIVIGVAAIVSLIFVSQGLENAVVSQFEAMGTDRIFITPGGAGITSYQLEGLTTNDVDVVENIPGVEWVNPYVMNMGEVSFRNEKVFSQTIIGMNPQGMEEVWGDMDFELEDGTFFKRNEKYSVIIGNDVAHKFFNRQVKVGNFLEIKDKKFRVQGIIESIGTPDDDRSITLPLEVFREIYDMPNEVSVIDLKVQKGVNIQNLADRIERNLKRSRNDEDFIVMTPDQILEQFNQVLIIIQIVLIGIATISLLVGGVGIMNSMYTNVLERTREIGIMKSIGATKDEILKIFIYESGMMGFVGGVLGAILGSIIALGVGKLAEQQGFKLLVILIDWKLILFGILFAFIIGVLSGYFPAKQAAKLNPVDSLRYGQ